MRTLKGGGAIDPKNPMPHTPPDQNPFRFDIIKTYPQRGPLCQHRLSASTGFECSRCSRSKKSKLVATILGDWQRLLCNACYGHLLSLWEIKSGELTDSEKHDELFRALQESTTRDQVEKSRRHILSRQESGKFLSQTALTMIATSEAVASGLSFRATELDWSAAIIGLCKALEVESIRLIAEPLRNATEQFDLSEDLRDRHLRRVARFCAGRSKPPELGSLAHFLAEASAPHRNRSSSILVSSLRTLSLNWPQSDWLFSQDGFITSTRELTQKYRNPAAHTELLTIEEYKSCNELIQGNEGMLWKLHAATQSYRKKN